MNLISPKSQEKSKSSSKLQMQKGELTINSNAPGVNNELKKLLATSSGNNQSMAMNEKTE